MGSTTIFTTMMMSSTYLALPRTLSLEKRKGSGKIFLDTTRTIFYQEWQNQLKTVFEFVNTLFSVKGCDFFISVDCKAVEGWSTSVPLFLLAASSITGELLPKNIFSTGCMRSPDGFISYANFKGTQAKIDALEHLVSYSHIEHPQFLVPFSVHAYHSETVQCIPVTSMFSVLKIALPETFQTYTSHIEKLSRVASQDSLRNVPHIPETGDAFVLLSADHKVDNPEYSQCNKGALIIMENVPPDRPVCLYFIREAQVLSKHFYHTTQEAREAASHYQEVFHEKS